jgi:signal transduction histidine kinase
MSANLAGKWVEILISDNGVGIPFDDQAHIFERFYRVHKHRARDAGGTGLGLSIVKNIILAHGGQISLRSTPGEGATFIIRLPVTQNEITSAK